MSVRILIILQYGRDWKNIVRDAIGCRVGNDLGGLVTSFPDNTPQVP